MHFGLRALALEPKVLVADEPTSALDSFLLFGNDAGVFARSIAGVEKMAREVVQTYFQAPGAAAFGGVRTSTSHSGARVGISGVNIAFGLGGRLSTSHQRRSPGLVGRLV